MIKDTEIQYKNTLVLNMFELTRFIDFWTEYSECCGDEEVYMCKNVDGWEYSHLAMTWLIPLKWKISDFNYDILDNAFNTGEEYNIINSDTEKSDFIDTVVITELDTFLYRWLNDKGEYIYETLDNDKIISIKGFIPLKWNIDTDDYESLDAWWTMNSTNHEIILNRWDFLFNINDYENENNVKDNTINLKLTSKYFDDEDLDYILWDIDYLKERFEWVNINMVVDIKADKETMFNREKWLATLRKQVNNLEIIK